jgi:hypothetical protein
MAVSWLLDRSAPSMILQRDNPTGDDPEALVEGVGAGVVAGGGGGEPGSADIETAGAKTPPDNSALEGSVGTAGPANGSQPATNLPPSATPPSPQPAPPLADSASMSARAFDAINKTFGNLRTMTRATIVALPLADIQQKYADICNRDHIPAPGSNPPRPWTKADASHVGGFYDGPTNTIYVNNNLPILGYVHELLHRNTSSDFRRVVGDAFNEGCTDRFALEACAAAGIANPGPPGYVWEMGVVDKVVQVVRETRLQSAYFQEGGTMDLVAKFELAQGAGKWAALLDAIKAHNDAAIDTVTTPNVGDFPNIAPPGGAYA